MKICKKCHIKKPLDCFYDRKTRDGSFTKRNECINCKLALDKIYIAKNKEKKAKRDKEYHLKNREERIKYQKWYYKTIKSKDKLKEKTRKANFYLNNKQKISNRVNKYRLTEKGKQVRLKSIKELRNCYIRTIISRSLCVKASQLKTLPSIILETKKLLISIKRQTRK